MRLQPRPRTPNRRPPLRLQLNPRIRPLLRRNQRLTTQRRPQNLRQQKRHHGLDPRRSRTHQADVRLRRVPNRDVVRIPAGVEIRVRQRNRHARHANYARDGSQRAETYDGDEGPALAGGNVEVEDAGEDDDHEGDVDEDVDAAVDVEGAEVAGVAFCGGAAFGPVHVDGVALEDVEEEEGDVGDGDEGDEALDDALVEEAFGEDAGVGHADAEFGEGERGEEDDVSGVGPFLTVDGVVGVVLDDVS